MVKRMRHWGLCLIAGVWLLLCAFAWFKPADARSEAERRPLAQFPKCTIDRVLSGSFMSGFSDYAADQFPLRESFRGLKAVVNKYALGQLDTNGIYIAQGHAAKMDSSLNDASLEHAVAHFNGLYESWLTQCGKIVFAIVPDKGYYLAESSDHLSLDYDALFDRMEEVLDWAEFVDITGELSLDSYYRTDTHWRQEAIPGVARRLLGALGSGSPALPDYEIRTVDRPFYGVYYGQAALPMEPDTICLLTNETLDGCSVYSVDTGLTTAVYDMDKLDSADLYEIYLSGGMAIQQITNPAGDPGKRLIVFRDSFGSSLTPLLLDSYGQVTLVDTRYISPSLLGDYVNFEGADVLLLYSTLVLNSSAALRN